ncbi:MAG: hydantoinase/oxoprolinase family protein [Deltaproteobacteria bacterium]|nr:hydantoinase/oxoprolinase family protein [Deltaproteobacteria bacterium]
MRIGIDVGGTFTDFLLTHDDGTSQVYKVLSTPDDPSIATMRGIEEMAVDRGLAARDFLKEVDVIVHGTTVTTNAVLTRSGAKTGLLTTKGVRDALEMRRGIREEQYNNRYENVRPLVDRRYRCPVRERLDYKGEVLASIAVDDVESAVALFKAEGVEAVAVCFMNSFANPEHEEQAAKILREKLPGLYLTVSAGFLPSIRFYDRVSTTALNSYVGPILRRYLKALLERLAGQDYKGVLLIMQSNGGVISPEVAIDNAAVTLLSGPAGGPVAGVWYTADQGYDDCITTDMGGTSFDAALVKNRTPFVTTVGEIDRLRIALPMLNVVTIGAGGGSIGWIDEGGLLRMGPQSAGSKPGPVCYGLGGELPTCTDADLVLGYLDKDYFAGGRIRLDFDRASRAIEDKLAKPLGLSLHEAAVGMYNLINTNMAAAVREVAVKQGQDPRDFPLVVAGGAGPNHACRIALELEIPLLIVPRESSIFCAAGMLMSDLKHSFVKTYATLLAKADRKRFKAVFDDMRKAGVALLASEGIREDKAEFVYSLDLRYVNQYHEVTVDVSEAEVTACDFAAMAKRFHPKHNALFGYSLEAEGAPVELINIRLVTVGVTEKPRFSPMEWAGDDPSKARKGRRSVFLPREKRFAEVDVFDGFALRFGNRIAGPAIIEQVNTTTFVTPEYKVLVDRFGNYTLYLPDREDEACGRILKWKR